MGHDLQSQAHEACRRLIFWINCTDSKRVIRSSSKVTCADGDTAAGSSAAPLAAASSSAAGPLPWLKSGAAGLMSPSV